jgi:membrane-associated phospholipid phosphatase
MDQTLFQLINAKWTNPVLDLFMAALSNPEIWKPLLILIALIALIFGGFKARACIFCMLLSMLIAEQVTGLLKTAIHRPRPKQVQKVRMVELQKARPEFLTLFKKPTIRYSDESDRRRSGPSFPSGHVTNNTVIAVCLTLFYRKRGALYWIVTAAIGYSRIYLGAHWPSDVLATFFLATGETLLILSALELLWRWVAPKWMPDIYTRHPSLMVDPAR